MKKLTGASWICHTLGQEFSLSRFSPVTNRLVQSTEVILTFEFHLWLQNEFADRARKNARYSVRAFAKSLCMEPSTVSQLLLGKRRASTKVLTQICDCLSVRPETRQMILQGSMRARTSSLAGQSKSDPASYVQMAADSFAVMADWYHYAILELTFTEGFRSDPVWISEQLGINPVEARSAIERMLRLELLKMDNGHFRKTQNFLTNYDEGFSAPALKELQRQILNQALTAVDHLPQDQKDITSMTMAIDPARLPEAKKEIRKFRRDLCDYLTQDSQTQVYNLGIQLFPISKQSKGEKR